MNVEPFSWGEADTTPGRCKKHPKYKGLAKPTSTCERCWQIWFGIADFCINCGCDYINMGGHEDDDQHEAE